MEIKMPHNLCVNMWLGRMAAYADISSTCERQLLVCSQFLMHCM